MQKASSYEHHDDHGFRTMRNADYYLFWRYEYLGRNPEFQRHLKESSVAWRSIAPLLSGTARWVSTLSSIVKMETGILVEDNGLEGLEAMADALEKKIRERPRRYETATEYWLKKILNTEISSMHLFGVSCRYAPNEKTSDELVEIMKQEKSLYRLQEGLSCQCLPETATEAVSMSEKSITLEIFHNAPMDIILEEVRERVEARKRHDEVFRELHHLEYNISPQKDISSRFEPESSNAWSRIIHNSKNIHISKNLDDEPRLAGIYIWDKVNNEGMTRTEARRVFRESCELYPQCDADANLHRIFRQTCKCIEECEVMRIS